MKITKEQLYQNLLYNLPVVYNKNLAFSPITMKDILSFQLLSQAITVRKNSIFRDKTIIKMSYLDFLVYCVNHKELESEYKIRDLSQFFFYALQLIKLSCVDADISIDQTNGQIIINSVHITPEIFDDIRQIIIIQNDIDFDIDEFLNYDTEQRLLKAQKDISKNEDKASMEDYIDSLAIAMHVPEETIMNMTIRKFWRYIKRYNLHESYTIAKTGECSGMVSYKEPIKHWMCSIEEDDKYKNLKTDENELRSKIG